MSDHSEQLPKVFAFNENVSFVENGKPYHIYDQACTLKMKADSTHSSYYKIRFSLQQGDVIVCWQTSD